MATKVFGVKIILKSAITENTDIGLYEVTDSNSELRWIQNSISGVSDWKEGIIVKNGIKNITKRIDLRKGGNIALPGSSGVSVINGNILWATLEASGVYLDGCIAEVYLFTGSTPAKIWTGVCKKPEWNSKSFTIPFVGNHELRKANILKQLNKNDHPYADIFDKYIPATFGRYRNIGKAKIKLVRTNNKFELLYQSDISATGSAKDYEPNGKQAFTGTASTDLLTVSSHVFRTGDAVQVYTVGGSLPTGLSEDTDYYVLYSDANNIKLATSFQNAVENTAIDLTGDSSGDCYIHLKSYGGISQFPVITGQFQSFSFQRTLTEVVGESTIPPAYGVLLGEMTSTGWNAGRESYLTGKYCKIISGDNSNGLYKKIVDSDFVCSGSFAAVTIAIGYAPTYLNGNTTGTATGQAFFEFYDVDNQFDIDTWPCGGMIDDNSVVQTQDATLYVKSGDTIIRMPSYSITPTSTTIALSLNLDRYRITDDGFIGFSTYPVSSIDLIPSITDGYSMTKYHADFTDANYPTKYPGLIVKGSSGTITRSFNLDGVNDRLIQTYAYQYISYDLDFEQSVNFVIAKPPKVPSGIDIKNAYLGGFFRHDGFFDGTSGFLSSIYLTWRSYYGAANNVIVEAIPYQDLGGEHYRLDLHDLPNYYWISGPSTDDDYFLYVNKKGDGLVSGYKNFDLGVSSKAEYDSIEEIFVGVKYDNLEDDQQQFETQFDIAELAIMLEHEYDISEEIYTDSFSGRYYSNSWGARVVTNSLMTSAVDILEHTCRLQNWQDTSICPTVGWGLQYADSPLIKTSGDGSFDETTLNTDVASYYAARQIFELSDGQTDDVKRTLCKNFFMANYQDKDGYECVKRVLRDGTFEPVATITLIDIVDRNQIAVTEPDPSEIYIEPFVRYNYDVSEERYLDSIAIKNTQRSAYTASYVSGIDNDDDFASTIWSYCHTLALRTRQITLPPEDLTDLKWANGEGGYKIAKDYLFNWIKWQYTKEIELPLHFETAGTWEECTKFNLQLPLHTNSEVKHCIVEEISISPNPPFECKVKAVML